MVPAVPIGMAARAVATVVVATIVTAVAAIVTLVGAAFVTHVITQRTTCAATCGCAHQAAGIATDAAADHVTTGCTQTAANGSFCTVTAISTYGRAACAAQASANRCTCAAAQLLTDNRAEYPTQCTAHTGFCGSAC
jgi:hypothetical protein